MNFQRFILVAAVCFSTTATALPAAKLAADAAPTLLISSVKEPEIIGPLILYVQTEGKIIEYQTGRMGQLGLGQHINRGKSLNYQIPEDRIHLQLTALNDKSALIFFYKDDRMTLRWSVLRSGEIIRSQYGRTPEDAGDIVEPEKYADYLEQSIEFFTNHMRAPK